LLVRAADLIGQLGDPHHLRKANALYSEFEEVGMNGQLGYASPADLTDSYPQFYWNSISPHIQTAIRYLNVTSRGRQYSRGQFRKHTVTATRAHLEQAYGAAARDRYWEILEKLQKELGYFDYLGALERFRIETIHRPDVLRMFSWLLDYPFAERLYPSALRAVKHVQQWGTAERGCSMNCESRCSSKQRLPTFSRSLVAQPSICR
jgi:hypothetical protein